MKDGEIVVDMFGRIHVFLNGLEALEQSLSKDQITRA